MAFSLVICTLLSVFREDTLYLVFVAAQEQPAEGVGSLRDQPCGLLFQVKSLCTSLLDANVLVQRNNLEIILFFFPFYTCLVSHVYSSGHFLFLQRPRAGVCIDKVQSSPATRLALLTSAHSWPFFVPWALCDFSWEQVTKCLFTPDRAPST